MPCSPFLNDEKHLESPLQFVPDVENYARQPETSKKISEINFARSPGEMKNAFISF